MCILRVDFSLAIRTLVRRLAACGSAHVLSGFFDDALVREVRERNNIVSVVGDYVTLRKAGAHYKGLCPFHSEKTPSFTVHEDRQFFYCFGCQTGGDVITFLRELNGYSFPEAVRVLADRAGIQLPERTRRDPRAEAERRAQRTFKDTAYEAGRFAQRFFVERLGSAEGEPCRLYLRERALGPEAVERFGLGFAPARWDGLGQELAQRGVDAKVAERVGLLMPRKSARGHYDRFRARLMFPIRSISGEVIGFSGRDVSGADDAPKYLNSPESPVFTKGDNLFGLYEARRALRTRGEAIVVEGNVDLVRLSVSGFEHVVAPLGTALTEAQCRLLSRFSERVVLLYDGDKAGRAATLKAIPTAMAAGLQVAVVALPDGDDPDSFLGREGPAALQGLMDAARSGWDVLVDHTLRDVGAWADPGGPVRAVDRLAPVLAAVSDDRQRLLFERRLASDLQLDHATLVRFVRRALAAQPGRPRQAERAREAAPGAPDNGGRAAGNRPGASPLGGHGAPAPGPPRRLPARELALLRLLMDTPEACALHDAHELGELLTDVGVRRVADRLARAWSEDRGVSVRDTIDELDDEALRAHLLRDLAETDPVDGWHEALDRLEQRLRIDALRRERDRLDRAWRQASRSGDDAESLRVAQQKIEVSRELDRLESNRGARWQS